jgi:hypothetical protein
MPSSFSKYAAFSSGVIPFVLSMKDAKYDPGAKAYFSALLPARGFGGSTRFGQMKNASPSSVTPEVRWVRDKQKEHGRGGESLSASTFDARGRRYGK